MSYILEALKKSERQRHRGVTPTLQVVQGGAVARKQPLSIYYGMLAAVLLGVGIMIGWLRPWQPEQPAPEAVPIVAKPAIRIEQQTAPTALNKPAKMPGETASGLPAQDSSAQSMQPVPGAEAVKPDTPAPVTENTALENTAMENNVPENTVAEKSIPGKGMPEKSMQANDIPGKHTGPVDGAKEQKVVAISELPLHIQQEIPAMTIQLHAYSGNPGERLVNINSRSLREGGYLTPELRLEQITPGGVIFDFKGYRFQLGIR